MPSTQVSFACAALAAAVLATPLAAQDQPADGRWLPFVGCWEAVGGEEEAGLLCFRMEGEGVSLTNYVNGEVTSRETLVADGRRQPVSVDGCEGVEMIEFSEDGRRAFTRTEFTCGTDEPRSGSGVMSFLAPNLWADVRTLEAGDEPFAWIQEYRLAGLDRIVEEGVEDPAAGMGMAVRSARAAAAAQLDLDNVIEASSHMDAKAVETWLVAKRDNFRPDGQDLVRLADAGIDPSVIDAVVAVSHPDRFVVEAGGDPEEYAGQAQSGRYRGYMGFNPFWGPAFGFSYGYMPYGYWGSGYYGYPGYGYGYWGYRPGYVVIQPRTSGGRIYNGRGYRPGSSSSSSNPSARGRSARPRGGGAQPSYSVGGRSGGGSPAASGGSRSGGRQATPRRAQRRPGGGR